MSVIFESCTKVLMSPPPFLVTVLSIVTATSNPTVLARILILTVPKNLPKNGKTNVPGIAQLKLDGFSCLLQS